ncbi:MAG: hypothetical protein RQ966_16940 [Acetobacteraceae bacterium]|nr:hypothetical protein [Acetobacteraceae bacterium]
MGIIADTIALLRPPIASEGEEAPRLPTVEDLRGALDAMGIEAADAGQLIASAPQRRTELLMQEGSDAAIRKLEQAVDRAHLQLERIEVLRPELHARIRALEAETRADAWLDYRTRLVEQLTACAIAQHAADQLAAGLRRLKLESMNAGYRAETAVIPFSLHAIPAGSFTDMARSMANVRVFTPADAALTWNVRFHGWTSVTVNPRTGPVGYQAGQAGGFDAETARLLIERGVAELADPKPLPPAPPKRVANKRTMVEQIRFEELQAGGRPVPAPPAALLPPEHPRTWTLLDKNLGGL